MNVAREARQREWIWEFFLKNCSDGAMIQGLLNAFPFPDDNPHMKRLLLLRLLSLQMAEGTIDSLTLDILRGLGQLSMIIGGSHVRKSVCYVGNKRKLSQAENNEHIDLSVEKKRKLSEDGNNEEGGVSVGATKSASPLKVRMLDDNSSSLLVFEQQCRESCELWLKREKPELLHDVEQKYEKMKVQDMLDSFLTNAWAATGQTVLERVSTDVVNGIYNPVNSSVQRTKRAGVASEDGESGKKQTKAKIWNRSSRQFSRSREKLQFGDLESEFETRNQDDAHKEDVSGKTPIATGGETTSDFVQIREHDVIGEHKRIERESVDEAHEPDVTRKLSNTTGDERTSDCVATGGEDYVTGQCAPQVREEEDVAHKTCLAAKIKIASADERTSACCVTGESSRQEPGPEDEAHVEGKLPIGTVDERISDCVETKGEHYVMGESTGQERAGEDKGTSNARSASGLDGQKCCAASHFNEEELRPLVADVESTKVGVALNELVANLALEFEKSIDKKNVENGSVIEGAQEAAGEVKGATDTKDRQLEETGNNERVVERLQECSSETCSLASRRASKPSDYMYPSKVREPSTSNNEQGVKEVDGGSKRTDFTGGEPLFTYEDAAHMDNVASPGSPQHQDEIQKDPTEVCFSPPPWVTRPSSPTVQADDRDADRCSKRKSGMRTAGLVSEDAGANARNEVASSAETGDLNLDTENIRRNLRRKQTALDAAVQDPLPKILTRSRGRRGLMEPNYTARTLEWEDEDEDDIQSTPKSPSASRRVQLPRADPKTNISPLVGATLVNGSANAKSNVSPLLGTKATSVNGSPNRAQSRRVHRRWSAQEVEALKVAVKKYGKGRWKLILQHNENVFQGRTEVDLKDKWRNLERYEGIRVEN